jgi:hypothetical protein
MKTMQFWYKQLYETANGADWRLGYEKDGANEKGLGLLALVCLSTGHYCRSHLWVRVKGSRERNGWAVVAAALWERGRRTATKALLNPYTYHYSYIS